MADRKQPDFYHTIIPYLTVADAQAASVFYQDVFGAEECINLKLPDGVGAHIEIKIGDTRFMIGGEYPDMGVIGPETLGGSGVTLMQYVDDVDAVIEGALAKGAELVTDIEDQFHGNRTGKIRDPFGHAWIVCTMIEDVDDVEVVKRFNQMMGG